MIKTSTAARLGLVGALTLGAIAIASPSASADQAPSATDVVGVGSDIVQYAMDFVADGDNNGHLGYNSAGNKNRLISFDATADGNGRNAFTDPLLGTSVALNPTITLRAGTYPVQRPNGGGAGLTALINDGSGGVSKNLISFVRSPNLPTATQMSTANTNLGSLLHTIEFAKDQQVIATASTTNAPAVLTATDLVNIYDGNYTTWNQVPGNSGGSTEAILPLIPQSGAGVRTVFLNALKAANGGVAITLGGNVKNVQQNDPTTVAGNPNAIVPFPVSRYDLLQSGYFHDPNAPYSQISPPAALNANAIKLEDPTAHPTAFSATIPYYIVFRESDAGSSTPWQPGSTLNWVQELFYNPGGPAPYIDTAPVQTFLTALGLTPFYQDLGNTTLG